VGNRRNQPKILFPFQQIDIQVPEAVGSSGQVAEQGFQPGRLVRLENSGKQTDNRADLAQTHPVIMKKFGVDVLGNTLLVAPDQAQQGLHDDDTAFLDRGFGVQPDFGLAGILLLLYA